MYCLILKGITSFCDFMIIPSASCKSFLMSQKFLIAGGTCFLCVGQPSFIIFITVWSSHSVWVELFNSCRRSHDMGKFSTIAWTIISMPSIKSMSFLGMCGALDNVSAIIKFFPGMYYTRNWYFWSLINKHCILGGVFARCFFMIDSRGLWSVCIIISLH